MHVKIQSGEPGMTVQLHSGPWWISPQRDLALAMPEYIRESLHLVAESQSRLCRDYRRGCGLEDMGRLAQGLAKYVREAHALGDERPDSAQEAFERAGLDDISPLTWQTFGYCLSCTLLANYWEGAHESARRQPIPYLGTTSPVDPERPIGRWSKAIRWLRERLLPGSSNLCVKLDSDPAPAEEPGADRRASDER